MFRCASFFAGVGGIDLGFEQAGFDVVYANEICQKASLTFKQNHQVRLDTRDIRDIQSVEIPDFDIMLAGFPCQAFSVAGYSCLLYTSPSPRDLAQSRMPSSA